MSADPVIEALRRTLQAEPGNGPLWLHLAELLSAANRVDEAILALRTAGEIEEVRHTASRRLIPLLRGCGSLDEALIRAEALLKRGEDAELRAELQKIQEAREMREEAAEQSAVHPTVGPTMEPGARQARDEGSDPTIPPASVSGDELNDTEWANQFDWGDLRITLKDVVGLEDVRRQINLKVLAPYRNPEIYQAFQRKAGGGLLLYGPPGCGKTFIARATAGELGARFLSIGIHEILDKYWGESERAIHALFERARAESPTVLFFDEFDALGSTRTRGDSTFFKSLVDQLLQEMDGFGGDRGEVLVFAATNMPWEVDPAFRRPGRFDRILLVPPPDKKAREELIRRKLKDVPGGESINTRAAAKRTELFTGADLVNLCELAAESSLERSLGDGRVHAMTQADFDRAIEECRSSAVEWLEIARNHAKFSNEGGRYDELVKLLKRLKRW